ncbi:ATP-binding protein [Novosphingobium sp. 9U]|uniref:ATP-binding protein n=1 Tax=Novosphingobium sp. 9U TaxID=2653158 RepID=UPI001358C599|nr:ATP-binding protein [Novosphingobium sp. 9U]
MRRSVSLLIIAGLLPVVALGGAFGAATFRNERRSIERQAQTDARFAAALISLKLRTNLEAVEMVAQSPAFDNAVVDTDRFVKLARRIIATRGNWRTLSVSDTRGQRLIDVPEPIGGLKRGRVVEMASWRRTMTSGQPQIGDVVRGPKGGLAFAVRAPIIQAGTVRYIVSGVLPADRLRQFLEFEPLPHGWIASVIDGAGQDVATTGDRLHPRTQGSVVESWAPVAGTPWKVRITTPAQAFSAPLRSAVLLLSGAVVLSLLLLAVLARLLATEVKQMRLREASELQRQRMEALGRLTGGVAHDFNNLLTPIVGGLDLIRRRVDDERTLRYVDAAATSADRAKALVGRLLSFSRRQSLAPEAVDLGTLLVGMTDLIEGSLTPAVSLNIQVPPSLCPALADRGQLELAILNLVINARDAMQEGGALNIQAGEATREQTAVLGCAKGVFVEVADNGAGMDEATLKQAIDPFFTTKPPERGTGLGLSMVHGFAAQSGGMLQLVSKSGEGTIARIVLRCSAERDQTRAAEDSSISLANARVLLVDDEEPVRRATAEMLKSAGHDVIEAPDVDSALRVLRAVPDIDAVITDFIMPRRSGGELIQSLRSHWPTKPILLITGYVTAEEELPRGVPRLMKPFNCDELLRALTRAIRSDR